MDVVFSKYHGCGNDFLIMEYNEEINNYSELVKKSCNRYVGIGADTFITIEDGQIPQVRFYNADGTEAPMCGNGIRCAASYLRNHLNKESNEYEILTASGLRKVYYQDDMYKINMGKPIYDIKKLDIDEELFCKQELFDELYQYEEKGFNLNAVFMTTHHLVIPLKDMNISDATISDRIGEYFCKHPLFKKMINVDFVNVIDKNHIKMRTFERGVGWTKACGSGACSCFAVLNRKNIIGEEMIAQFEYGEVVITKENGDIYMKGPAVEISKRIEFTYKL